MDTTRVKNFVEKIWDDTVVPTLTDYMRIPNKSPAFDPEWQSHGYMRDAVKLMEAWARDHLPRGATLDIVQLPDRTPLMFMEIPGESKETILLYGHLDKQPEMVGWAEGTGPWTPVRIGDKLFGRGGADDGYAMFAALSAVLALRDQQAPHARCVIVIEACEESGSPDLPFYVDHLAARIGEPSLVICLDSGCGDYERLWLTTSLRGMAAGTLTVRVLDEGVHSGDASGVVPSSFRILFELLARLEDQKTGDIVPSELYVHIPPQRVEQARGAAEILGDSLYTKFPFAGQTGPVTKDLAELVLNRTWRPQLAVIGIDGVPAPQNAGNVMLPDHDRATEPAAAADVSRRRGRRDVEAAARRCAALWQRRVVHGQRGGKRLECARAVALARGSGARGIPISLRAGRRPIWARAEAFRSWRCWARNFRARSSW